MSSTRNSRRSLLTGLGALAAAVGLSARPAQAQTAAGFTPARHPEDEWMARMPGKHRVVLDVTSPEGLPDAIRFAGNLFAGNKTGYGVEEQDMAMVICVRHGATPYGYDAAIWSKYGKVLDPKATPAATANPYNSGDRTQLSALAKRGVQFMVCGTSSRGIAGRIAGPNGDADAVLKEMGGGLIPSARIVAAGVVGVTHAQEHGYSLIYVG